MSEKEESEKVGRPSTKYHDMFERAVEVILKHGLEGVKAIVIAAMITIMLRFAFWAVETATLPTTVIILSIFVSILILTPIPLLYIKYDEYDRFRGRFGEIYKSTK